MNLQLKILDLQSLKLVNSTVNTHLHLQELKVALYFCWMDAEMTVHCILREENIIQYKKSEIMVYLIANKP